MTKTRRERRIDQWRLFGAFAFMLLAFIAMLTGCASVGPTKNESLAHDARLCLETSPCVVVQVTNDQWLDASVWINGARKGTVNGLGSLTLFIPVSQLTEGGRCLVASFRTIANHDVYASGKECLQARGGHFTLQFDSLRKVWLTPWANL